MEPVIVPPMPVFANWPLEELGELVESALWGRIFSSRSMVAFQLHDSGRVASPDGHEFFIVVSRDPAPGNTLMLLPARLCHEVMRRESATAKNFITVGAVFDAMEKRGYSAWLVLFEDITTALFLRKRPDDPEIKKIVGLNKQGANPRLKVTAMNFLTRDGPNGEQIPLRTEIHIGSGRPRSRKASKGGSPRHS